MYRPLGNTRETTLRSKTMKIETRTDVAGMRCTAHFSDDEIYRYYLEWRWSNDPLLVVCMLNPSTATHEIMDPTIRGLIRRADAWRYGGIAVVNLFAYRSTSPKVMKKAPNPVGPDNDDMLVCVSEATGNTLPIVAAWGNHGRFQERDSKVLQMLKRPFSAFASNANGTPKHPLYVPRSLQPSDWYRPSH